MLSNVEDLTPDENLVNIDKDEILNRLSDDIILDNVLTQISGIKSKIISNNNPNNYFDYFMERYKFILNKYSTNQEIIDSAKDIMKDISTQIINKLSESFDFNIKFVDSLSIEDYIFYIKCIYEFFVIRLYENIISFNTNYIINNTKSLLGICKVSNKKDLSYISIKKVIDNKYTPIIMFTHKILVNIDSIDNETTIELIVSDDENLESNYYVNKMFVEGEHCDITFNTPLFQFIKDINIESEVTINKVQKNLIEYYLNITK